LKRATQAGVAELGRTDCLSIVRPFNNRLSARACEHLNRSYLIGSMI
jgi:hypothetical protein